MTKIPACLAAARTSPARSKVCRSCTMGFCAMFPAEKSAMSSAVVLLSSVISAIPHLPLALTTPLGYVRSTDVCRDGHEHACRISPSLHVTAAPPRVGSRHRTPPVRRIIPEHQRGLQTGEASEACHGFTPPAVLDTPCRTESAHRTCRPHQDMCVTAERVPTLGVLHHTSGEQGALPGLPAGPSPP